MDLNLMKKIQTLPPQQSNFASIFTFLRKWTVDFTARLKMFMSIMLINGDYKHRENLAFLFESSHFYLQLINCRLIKSHQMHICILCMFLYMYVSGKYPRSISEESVGCLPDFVAVLQAYPVCGLTPVNAGWWHLNLGLTFCGPWRTKAGSLLYHFFPHSNLTRHYFCVDSSVPRNKVQIRQLFSLYQICYCYSRREKI